MSQEVAKAGGEKTPESRVADGLRRSLDENGYSFQHAVVKLAQQAYEGNASPWRFAQTEFPVEVRGHSTRIDIVLKRDMKYMGYDQRERYLLAECKRANPALSNWCFVRAPYTRSNHQDGMTMWERALVDDAQGVSTLVYPQFLGQNYGPYHIAQEVKTDQLGDKSGGGRDAIEDAATQILRGLNGMVEHLSGRAKHLQPGYSVSFVPVIFTTAQLWVSDVDISTANPTTGKLSPADLVGCEPRDWLFYEYNMSPGLKHSRPYGDADEVAREQEIFEVAQREYVRTIAVVSARGIIPFLGWSGHIK